MIFLFIEELDTFEEYSLSEYYQYLIQYYAIKNKYINYNINIYNQEKYNYNIKNNKRKFKYFYNYN